MPEWLMGADCKSAGNAYAGSNPARPKNRMFFFPAFYRRLGEGVEESQRELEEGFLAASRGAASGWDRPMDGDSLGKKVIRKVIF